MNELIERLIKEADLNADQAQKLAAAQQLGGFAQAGQNMNLADINALATMGGQQQTIAQNEELFPLQTLNQGAQALRGYSIPTSVNSTYTGPIPGAYASSPLQQIAGLGAVIAAGSGTDFGKYVGNKVSGWLNTPKKPGQNPGSGADAGGGTIDIPTADTTEDPLAGNNNYSGNDISQDDYDYMFGGDNEYA
jgi:hypothetical protein